VTVTVTRVRLQETPKVSGSPATFHV